MKKSVSRELEGCLLRRLKTCPKILCPNIKNKTPFFRKVFWCFLMFLGATTVFQGNKLESFLEVYQGPERQTLNNRECLWLGSSSTYPEELLDNVFFLKSTPASDQRSSFFAKTKTFCQQFFVHGIFLPRCRPAPGWASSMRPVRGRPQQVLGGRKQLDLRSWGSYLRFGSLMKFGFFWC